MSIEKTQPAEVSKWEQQIDLVRSMAAKDATPQEFDLMLHMARTYGLDPLTKQIWLVKYGNAPASIFCGRDGFLEIGHRSGNFDGMETTVDVVQQPIDRNGVRRPWQYMAKCSVYCKSMRHPITVQVFEDEYTTGRNLWKDKTRTMIAKVAESQALRRAFRISGLYSPEEMPEQPEKDITPQPERKPEANSEQPEKDITPQPERKPEANSAQAEFERRMKAFKSLPKVTQEGLDWLCKREMLKDEPRRERIANIIDANESDPARIDGLLADLGWKGSAALSDVAADDKMAE